MKTIVISIRPKWAAKILNGEKIIELRKSMPSELPCRVLVYCTKGKHLFAPDGYNEHWWTQRLYNGKTPYNGRIVAEFTLDKTDNIGKYAYAIKDDFFYETLKKACLTVKDLTGYANITRAEFERKGAKLYAWHISDLKIFDKPKDLSDYGLKRAPQSWCYAKEAL